MNRDQVKGRVDRVKGKAREMLGKAIGNERLEQQGVAQRTEGRLRATYGDVKADLHRNIR